MPDPTQLILTGGAVAALVWIIRLIVDGKLHSNSEVEGLRKDKADLLAVNERLGEALETSNRLLEQAIGGHR